MFVTLFGYYLPSFHRVLQSLRLPKLDEKANLIVKEAVDESFLEVHVPLASLFTRAMGLYRIYAKLAQSQVPITAVIFGPTKVEPRPTAAEEDTLDPFLGQRKTRKGRIFHYISQDTKIWRKTLIAQPQSNALSILTGEEKVAWLDQESDFPKPITKPVRRGLTDNSSDEDLTEPFTVIHL